MEGSSTTNLLSKVAKRMQINCIFDRLRISIIIFSVIYALLMLTSRLTGLIPDIFSLSTIFIPLLVSLLAAFCIPLKIGQKESAVTVDKRENTDDLFLTATTIQNSNGKFKDLVSRQAEEKAATLKAEKIVSFNWKEAGRNLAISIAILILGIYTLPQLDPFGKEEERAKKELKSKSLEEARKETEKRLVKLKKEAERPKDSDAAKSELTEIFKELKMKKPEEVRKKLRQQRRKMAKMWTDKNKELSEEKKQLKISSQSFGLNSDELRKISKDLKKGDSKSAVKKLSELKDKLEGLSDGELNEDKKKEIADIKKEIEDLRDAINEGAGAESVKAAIDRALSQMEELSDETKQALADAAKSLELGERELQRLQKMMDEMEELQQMMQTAQQADQLAQQMQNNPNGQTPPEYESFQEYQDYLDQLEQGEQQQGQGQICQTCEGSGKCVTCNGTGEDVEEHVCLGCRGDGKCPDCKGRGSQGGQQTAGGQNGQGQGQNGQGQGQNGQGAGQQVAGNGSNGGRNGGGTPGEKEDDASTIRQNAKSKTQPGRILMEWKTKGLSENGEVTEEYQAAMQEIREGVDEAISKEKIPPGYHEIIKKYFSSEGLNQGESEKK